MRKNLAEWRLDIMIRSRLIRALLSIIMVTIVAGGIFAGQAAVLAQGTASDTTTTPVAAKLKLDCPYPALAAASGSTFSFEVDIKLTGTESKLFNLSTTSLNGWKVTTTAAISGKEVSAVQLTPLDDPTYPVTETIIVSLAPYTQVYPEPGDYKITFKVSSDTLTESLDLKGTVTPQYSFILTTETENLLYVYQNSSPTVNISEKGSTSFSFSVVNKGSATINDLAMSAETPAGWKVVFTPEKVEPLAYGMMQQVNAAVTPPSGDNVPGDYLMKFRVDNGEISSTMDVRVSVGASTFPAWAFMIIIAVVIVALAVAYQLFFNKRKVKPAEAK
jgi:uncharacterized membrane protein